MPKPVVKTAWRCLHSNFEAPQYWKPEGVAIMKQFFPKIGLFVLVALVLALGWIGITSVRSYAEQLAPHGDLIPSHYYKGRVVVTNSCSGQSYWRAYCPDGYVLTGGGGYSTSALQTSMPSCQHT